MLCIQSLSTSITTKLKRHLETCVTYNECKMFVVHRNYHCLEIVLLGFWQVLRNWQRKFVSFWCWFALTFIFTLWKFWRINCAAFSNRNISSVLVCKRTCSACRWHRSVDIAAFSSSSRLHNRSSSPMLIAKFPGQTLLLLLVDSVNIRFDGQHYL